MEVIEEFLRPVPIYQHPVTGLDLRPSNFSVILFAAWVDANMMALYWRNAFHLGVGLS